jgi:hypothetical protein
MLVVLAVSLDTVKLGWRDIRSEMLNSQQESLHALHARPQHDGFSTNESCRLDNAGKLGHSVMYGMSEAGEWLTRFRVPMSHSEMPVS